MKKLILILMLCGSAQAELFAYAKTEGGNLNLFSEDCKVIDGWKFVMLVDSSTGKVFTGCWLPMQETNQIIVIYDDGDKYAYDYRSFTIAKTPGIES